MVKDLEVVAQGINNIFNTTDIQTYTVTNLTRNAIDTLGKTIRRKYKGRYIFIEEAVLDAKKGSHIFSLKIRKVA